VIAEAKRVRLQQAETFSIPNFTQFGTLLPKVSVFGTWLPKSYVFRRETAICNLGVFWDFWGV
jgi:hypothetical protein